jgi:hypothetical protein
MSFLLFFPSLLDPFIFCVGALLLPRCAVTVYMRFFLSILYHLPYLLIPSPPSLPFLFLYHLVLLCVGTYRFITIIIVRKVIYNSRISRSYIAILYIGSYTYLISSATSGRTLSVLVLRPCRLLLK